MTDAFNEPYLPSGGTVLSRDKRPIQSIFWPVEGAEGFTVGSNGIEKIVAYDEQGDQSFVPWLAVFVDGQVLARVPAAHVSVHYAINKEEER